VNRDRQVDLSVIIVNYNVAPLVLECVASLAGQRFAAHDGDEGRLEILVVDNASSPQDLARLEGLRASVTLLRSERNLGFAAANNRAIERGRGRFLCFLNPDTKVLDGALDALLQHCYRRPDVGAVGPKVWADDDRRFLLPPADPPTLRFILAQLVSRAIPEIGRRHGARWRARAVEFWRSRGPLRVPMLSGACIVTSRAVLERIGGFDPRYFLYYEDADWCRRVRRGGYRLAYVPEAEIVHYYNQSAKQDPVAAQRYALESQGRFVQAHYGAPGMAIYKAALALSRWASASPARPPLPGLVDLGRVSEPPRLSLNRPAGPRVYLAEIAHDPLFVPSVAAFLERAELDFSPAVWARMQPGRYYARLIDPDTLHPLAHWSWEKG
jgi:GT2 family glycosyltransferase